MAAAVRVRTMRFDEPASVGDADGEPLALLAPPIRKQIGLPDRLTNSIGRNDDPSEVWFKDNRLGHRQQAAYLRRLERLRHDLHDTEQEHLRDSLDRLFRGGAVGKLPEAPAPPPPAAAAVGAVSAAVRPLADRRAPWLARSPEERALLESAREGTRRTHSHPRRTAEPPAPAVRRLLASDAPDSNGDARRHAASGNDNGLTAPSNSGFSRGGIGAAAATAAPSPSVVGHRDGPAAAMTTASFAGLSRASPPCAPTIPTLNRTPSKFSVAASSGTARSRGGSQKANASTRCSRTAPTTSTTAAGGRGRLAKCGFLARAVTAMRASAAASGSSGGGDSLHDSSVLVVPGKRLALAPADDDYDSAASVTTLDLTPLASIGDSAGSSSEQPQPPPPAAAAALIEPGLRIVVLPDPGARTLSRSTDVKCESALRQRTRSVTFVSSYA